MDGVAAKPWASEAERHCNNGGCTRPVYRGTECFRCWAGTKWDGMKARVRNRGNYYPQWEGLPLEITRRGLIAWAFANPPADGMEQPSIDRIDSSKGYTLDNIRWLPMRQNGRNVQHDIPLTHRRCPRCLEVKLLGPEHFHRNRANRLGFQTYCRGCRASA